MNEDSKQLSDEENIKAENEILKMKLMLVGQSLVKWILMPNYLLL
jgi:hypothetical protein